MNTETQDIEMLSRAIMTEVRDEAEQIKAEAKEKADAIRRRGQEQAEQERRAILERAREDAERLRGQAIATAQLQARSQQLANREQLLDRVFQAVRERLAEIPKRSDYDQIVAQLLREAVTDLRVKNGQVKADPVTQKVLEKGVLAQVSRDVNGEFSSAGLLEEGTGIIISTADGKLNYDNTLETRLQRLEGSLRAAVYKVLIGE